MNRGCLPGRNAHFLVLALVISISVVSNGVAPLSAAVRAQPQRLAKHLSADFDQVMRENAVFFNMLTTFSFTVAISEYAWGQGTKNINVNLISRGVRDSRGQQYVRARIAGVVRSNYNVELNILDDRGVLVGKGFFGYRSGQITFYDRNDKAIISGFMDSRGDYLMDDLRLPEGKQDLANGFVDPCFGCTYLGYGWWDGLEFQVGGGRIYPYPSAYYGGGKTRVYWTFDRGKITETKSALGEAEYDIAGETTGAINSVLFDTDRTAESFFASPYSQVPAPVGLALIPRFTDDTGIAVTNASNREADISYVARRSDGTLVSGDGIENPVTYTFAAGQQYTAFPADIFRGLNEKDRRSILGSNEVGWIEIFSDDDDVQAMFLDADSQGTALDGNIGFEDGSSTVVFSDIRMGARETTEISLLNKSYEDARVRLELFDRDGRVLAEESEFFIAGYGMRNFDLGGGSRFLTVADPTRVAGLRVTCDNGGLAAGTSCGRIIGLASYYDRYNSMATTSASSGATSGQVLVGSYFVAGKAGRGAWETAVNAVRMSGASGMVHLDVYDSKGKLIKTLQQTAVAGGHASFVLNDSTLSSGDRLTSGYVRVRTDTGEIAGNVTVSWSDGKGSMVSSYPLANFLYRSLQFNQVAQGKSGSYEYWTGLALLNDLDKSTKVEVKVVREDGSVDQSVIVTLKAYEQKSAIITELVEDDRFTRLEGYIQIRSDNPVSAIVLYGDTGSRFLAAVPGIAR